MKKISIILWWIFTNLIISFNLYSQTKLFPVNLFDIPSWETKIKKEFNSSPTSPQYQPNIQTQALQLYQRVKEKIKYQITPLEFQLFQKKVELERFSLNNKPLFYRKMNGLSFNRQNLINLSYFIEKDFLQEKANFWKEFQNQVFFWKDKYQNLYNNKQLNQVLFNLKLVEFILLDPMDKTKIKYNTLAQNFIIPDTKLKKMTYSKIKRKIILLTAKEKMIMLISRLISDTQIYLNQEAIIKLKQYFDSVAQKEKEILKLKDKAQKLQSQNKLTQASEILIKIENLKKNLNSIDEILIWKKIKILKEKAKENLKNLSLIKKILQQEISKLKERLEEKQNELITFAKNILHLCNLRRSEREKFKENILTFKELSNFFYTVYLHPEADISTKELEQKFLLLKENYDILEKQAQKYKNFTQKVVSLLKEDYSTNLLEELELNKLFYDLIPPYFDLTSWEKEKFLLLSENINLSDPISLVKDEIYDPSLNLAHIFEENRNKYQKIKFFREKIKEKNLEKKEKRKKYKEENKTLNIRLKALINKTNKFLNKDKISFSQKKLLIFEHEELKKELQRIKYFYQLSSENEKLEQLLEKKWQKLMNKEKIKTQITIEKLVINSLSYPLHQDIKQIPIITSSETFNGNIEIKVKIREHDYPIKKLWLKTNLSPHKIKGHLKKRRKFFSYWLFYLAPPLRKRMISFNIIAEDQFGNKISPNVAKFTFIYKEEDIEREIESFFQRLFFFYNEKNIIALDNYFTTYQYLNGNYWELRDKIKNNFTLYTRLYIKVINLTIQKKDNIYFTRIEWERRLGKDNTDNLSEGIAYFYLIRNPNFKIIAIKGDNPFF